MTATNKKRWFIRFLLLTALVFFSIFLYNYGKAKILLVYNVSDQETQSSKKVRVIIDGLSPIDVMPGETKTVKVYGRKHILVLQEINADWTVKSSIQKSFFTKKPGAYKIILPAVESGGNFIEETVYRPEEPAPAE